MGKAPAAAIHFSDVTITALPSYFACRTLYSMNEALEGELHSRFPPEADIALSSTPAGLEPREGKRREIDI